ncbi:hypothetical protein BGZ99_002734 [Dissophora globulifera]|uniref:Uncharacterized protein n=1 Tax=Dissophora globulifera TaxID=979702 RepID=A0A9P6RMM1_9FUNG|nr:hypothetical protein BGZ99_002734 [Dissophora globulifera]
MDFLETYNPTNVDRLMLHDIAYKCSCMTCSQGKPEEDYDVLSSSLNPNIKAGFARYRDHRDKQPAHQVEPLRLSCSEIEYIRNKLNTHGFPHEKVIALSIVAENCKTQLFSGSMELMKNVLTSSIDNNQYNPFGTFHSIELKKPVPADGIEGYKRLDDTTWECLFCKRVTNIDSDEFLCLRVDTRGATSIADCALQQRFLKALVVIRCVISQDTVNYIDDGYKGPVLEHPVFQTPEFIEFYEEASKASDKPDSPAPADMPESVQQSIRESDESLRNINGVMRWIQQDNQPSDEMYAQLQGMRSQLAATQQPVASQQQQLQQLLATQH